ncbi:alpha/beta hydrolase [Polaribacter pacificus]|uniref:Alpha/beta hydrolase n=1 Tax=Polaribacter pacificus TaxID=1775173 RepID=A0A917I018_9FLAO|nr:alpha/beta hydrolase [Polaribacter pacificus]GGH00730.1 alpha/beta hydrolase [Polaribacter pacificus]
MKTKLLLFLLFVCCYSFGQKAITSEELVLQNDSIILPGTLSYTKTGTPLIIWIHGSGNVDRNGNQLPVIKANYIQQFREAINQEDLAFFSYDKRTASKENMRFLSAVLFTDFVNDAKKVVQHFKKDPRFTKIILIGHSQGSLVAMLASENTDGFISIAGPGESIDQTMIKQISKQNANLGTYAAKHFKELKETGTIKTVNPFLMTVFAKQNFAFLNSWAVFNPSEEIKKIKIPTLILQGTKDLQVVAEDAQQLHNSKSNASLVYVENMNHVLKEITEDADNLKSYYSAAYPLSKELIETIVAFIKK